MKDNTYWESLVGISVGQYQLEEFLGAGSFGAVYRAQPVVLGKIVGPRVALKLLRVDGADGGYALREVQRIADLFHAHVIRIFGHPAEVTLKQGEEDVPALYFVMELAEASLDDVLRRGPLSGPEVLELARALASGLAYLHRDGKIVHRDVRPPNVLKAGGVWKLSDFSLARPLEDIGDYRARYLPKGIEPPESLDDLCPQPSWDVWALGIVVVWAATGKHPFDGLGGQATLERVVGSHALPLPPLEERVARIAQGCLEKEPERRWTAKNVVEEIAAIEGRIQDQRSRPSPPPASRRRVLGGMGMIAVGAIGLGVGVVMTRRADSPVPASPLPEVKPPPPTPPPAPTAAPSPGGMPWKVLSGIWRQPGCVFQDGEYVPRMVVVPRGEFWMGSSEDEPGRSSDEGPRHRVEIGYDLALGECAVSFAEWDAYALDGGPRPADRGWGRGDLPVINVSWDDAQGYLGWLNRRLGLMGRVDRYRLPSESEWEYGARGGTETPFWWGRTITPAQANYDGNFVYAGGGSKGEYRQRTVQVRSFSPNPFGLYQVHGNVWEWVEDQYNNYTGAPTDGSALVKGGASSRVLRGGSWNFSPYYLRSAYRFWGTPDNRDSDIGFRVARTLKS